MPLSYREPPPTTASGLLLPLWKAPGTVRNHPPEYVDEIFLWCYTPLMSCSTANMAARPKMLLRPAQFAPSRQPRREASQPRTLWEGSSSTPVPSVVVACGPWLELLARFGNRRPCSINSRSLSWLTSGWLTSSIFGPSTSPMGVSNRIWRHCWGISGFPGGYGEWCLVSVATPRRLWPKLKLNWFDEKCVSIPHVLRRPTLRSSLLTWCIVFRDLRSHLPGFWPTHASLLCSVCTCWATQFCWSWMNPSAILFSNQLNNTIIITQTPIHGTNGLNILFVVAWF